MHYDSKTVDRTRRDRVTGAGRSTRSKKSASKAYQNKKKSPRIGKMNTTFWHLFFTTVSPFAATSKRIRQLHYRTMHVIHCSGVTGTGMDAGFPFLPYPHFCIKYFSDTAVYSNIISTWGRHGTHLVVTLTL